MKKFKKVMFKTIIVYVIFYTLLGSFSTVLASRGYDAACGEYVSQYARDYVKTYVKTDSSGIYNNVYDNSSSACPCYWSGGADGSGVWHVCCTTGIQLMYKQALGVELTSMGWSLGCKSTMSAINNAGSTLHKYFDVIKNESDLKAGDILCRDGHNEMYVGNEEHFNSGSGSRVQSTKSVVKIYPETDSLGSFTCALRLKNTVQVDPSGKVTGTGSIAGQTIDYSDFFFNGIPDGKYSIASRKNIFQIIAEALAALLNFFTGLLTYLIRGVIISFISVFDRLLNNTIDLMNGNDKTLEDSGVSATSADDPTSINRAVTIEGLVFGDEDMDLFDINIFKVD